MTADTALVYTVHDLGEDASRIIAAAAEAGKPALITAHGRFVAVLTPLKPGEVEERVLPEMAREIGQRGTA